MRQTFLNFLENKRNNIITEAFNSKKIDKALGLVETILSKHIKSLVPIVGFVKTKQGNDVYYSKQYLVKSNNSMFQLNFKQEKSAVDIYSIDFFNNTGILWNGKAKSNLTIYTLGGSIVYFLPIIWTVAETGNYNLTTKEAIKLGRSKLSQIKESYAYYVNALKYNVYENLEDNVIYDTWKLSLTESLFNNELSINEVEEEVRNFKNKKVADLQQAYAHKNDSLEAKNIWKTAIRDIKDIDNAIKGGANTLNELKIALKHNVNITTEIDDKLKEIESKLKEEHEDPDLVFNKMQKYVKMIIKGINPSVILCGAPGVGKTYNVKKQLKAAGYNEGHNLCTIKGKCTPRILYYSLYQYKNKGNIVLIDDADGLVGPGAPEECINILKAALDSTADDEGRLISYGVAGKLLDDEGNQIPKKFYYNGGIIIITNYQAGSLDSALKGRSFIQDIHFNVEDMLNRIKKLLPEIDPMNLSSTSKIKAFDYLVELSKEDNMDEMEISIRTFTICAKIFETASGDVDFDEDDVKSMIKEQMKLQSQKNKRKY